MGRSNERFGRISGCKVLAALTGKGIKRIKGIKLIKVCDAAFFGETIIADLEWRIAHRIAAHRVFES